jgi:hypothetical protein
VVQGIISFHGNIGIGIINLNDMPSNSTGQIRVKDDRLPEASVAQWEEICVQNRENLYLTSAYNNQKVEKLNYV